MYPHQLLTSRTNEPNIILLFILYISVSHLNTVHGTTTSWITRATMHHSETFTTAWETDPQHTWPVTRDMCQGWTLGMFLNTFKNDSRIVDFNPCVRRSFKNFNSSRIHKDTHSKQDTFVLRRGRTHDNSWTVGLSWWPIPLFYPWSTGRIVDNCFRSYHKAESRTIEIAKVRGCIVCLPNW